MVEPTPADKREVACALTALADQMDRRGKAFLTADELRGYADFVMESAREGKK